MGQTSTGKLTEERIRESLESLGLCTRKPVPDRGVDLEVWYPDSPSCIAKIQVKGRNPEKVKTYRWFQLRLTKKQLGSAKSKKISPTLAWREKLGKVDFLILDAVKTDETWVLPLDRAKQLVLLNEKYYKNRRANIEGRQKEMNLDLVVDGYPLTERFRDCLKNFALIINFLSNNRLKTSCRSDNSINFKK